MVAPEQFSRMARDQNARWAIEFHKSQSIATFSGLQHFQRDSRIGAKSFQYLVCNNFSLVRLKSNRIGQRKRLIPLLHYAEESGHESQILFIRSGMGCKLKKFQEVVGTPFFRHIKQGEKIPYFQRRYLHGRSRQ